MLSEALRLIRVFHDLKQAELASRIGLSNSYLSEIEKGKKTPTIEIIQKYAEEFSIPASSILFFSEQLADQTGKLKFPDSARGVIAGKVINFLQFIESRTVDDVT